MKPSQIIKATGFALLALSFANPALAGRIQNCTGGLGDYSDAPASYGVACHDTNRWQQLGNAGTDLPGNSININNFNNPEWTAESSPNAVDAGDGGVKWSTSSDGVNWSSFGQSDDLVVGQFVQFQVDIQRADEGNHNYDAYKVWVDWFGTGTFDENTDLVLDGQWQKDEDSEGNEYTGTDTAPSSSVGYNSPDMFGTFFSSILQVPLDAMLGEIWMRARVACDWSFNNSNGNALYATGYYHQGEVEDYSMRIVNNVNAPATGLLFSALALGLVLRRKS